MMTLVLNHTIMPAWNHEESAKLFADIFGLPYQGTSGHFAPVQVNEHLSIDFDTDGPSVSRNMKNPEPVPHHHLAFMCDDEEFDTILERVTEHGMKYGSGPGTTEDMKIAERNGGRTFYFKDPNGHSYELMTTPLG